MLHKLGEYCYAAAVPSKCENRPTDYELAPLAEVLSRRFIQRWDCYPLQTDNGKAYYTVHEPLHIDLLYAHLRRDITLGTYLLNEQSRGRFLVLDADNRHAWQRLVALNIELRVQAISTYLEKSRRGGHLWFFFDGWLPGKDIRQFAQGVLAANEMHSVEIYPKQGEVGAGPGSLVRLPFGVHRKNQRRYSFVHADGTLLSPTIGEQLRVLERPQMVPKTALSTFIEYWEKREASKRKTAVLLPVSAQREASDDSPLSQHIKAGVSIREFIGQFVELSPSGQGLCPFHDDHHPSFSVNDEENYWYCFACNKGGSVIDFWMMLQGCDFKTAVSDLAKKF